MRNLYVLPLRIALFIAVIDLSSNVQVYGQTTRGSLELGIEAGAYFFILSGGHETVGGLGLCGEPHINYFITDQIDIGATGFFYHSIDSDPSLPAISIGGVYGHANYHFNSGGTFSPFIGLRIGVVRPYLETQFAAGAQAGLQFFVDPAVSINGQLDIITSTGFGFLSCLVFGLSFYIR